MDKNFKMGSKTVNTKLEERNLERTKTSKMGPKKCRTSQLGFGPVTLRIHTILV